MDKNIYDLLNEGDIDLDDYEQQELSYFEQQKLFKKFTGRYKVKKDKKGPVQKWGIVAAASIVVIGTFGAIPAMATMNPGIYKIADILGINKNLEPYESVIGKSVTKEGVNMMINQVIVDNDRILVSTVTTGDSEIMKRYGGPTGRIYINGEEVNNGSIADVEKIDEYTGHCVITFPIEKQLEGELDIRLELGSPLAPLEGQWQLPSYVYEFTANGEALSADTKIHQLNKKIEIEDGKSVTLEKYLISPFMDRIYFEVDNIQHGSDDYSVQGTDQEGNQVKYDWRMMNDAKSEFLPEPAYANLIQEATTLTLSLYLNDEPVGETFTITR